MSAIWVDTDFGFDDLWALLLLRHLDVRVAGISLVAGNAPLDQVIANATGARQAYGLEMPIYAGAERPLVRSQDTAQRILGPRGMSSRGKHLPEGAALNDDTPAGVALRNWLGSAGQEEGRVILAIGPLTNIAHLVQEARDMAQNVTRLIWMGGSNGAGNHSPQAEFNALADPEAAAIVAGSGIPMDVIDLELCRQVTFGEQDMPRGTGLTADLLGGYLDIGLSRGRSGMAIYDPLAALATCQPEAFTFQACRMSISITPGETYGKTTFTPQSDGPVRLAVASNIDAAQICLDALAGDLAHVT